LRRHPAETVSSRTGVPRSRGRPPERPGYSAVMPTRPRPHTHVVDATGVTAPETPLIWIAPAREATTLANRDGIAERERVGGSRPRSAERGKGEGNYRCRWSTTGLPLCPAGSKSAGPGRAGPGCVPRNAGKGRRLPAPAPGTGRSRPVDSAGVCGWRAVPACAGGRLGSSCDQINRARDDE
jgi:hypothetical protein